MLNLPATHSYLQTLGEGSTLKYCAVLAPGNGMILDVPAMLSHVIIFDRGNNRLRFAPQKGCPSD